MERKRKKKVEGSKKEKSKKLRPVCHSKTAKFSLSIWAALVLHLVSRSF